MSQAPTVCDLLIHNGLVLTADGAGRIIAGCAIAVSGTRIIAVGDSADLQRRFAPVEDIDAQGGIVHPGFIDAHIHISQYTSRSVLPLMAGTQVTMGDWKAALTPEDEHASATLAAVDYLRCGYTGFVDPGTIFEPDAVAAVAEEVGIRIWLTDPYVADMAHILAEHEPDLVSPGFTSRWPRTTDEALQRVGKQLYRNRDADGLVRGFIGLYGAATASEPLTAHALDVARRAGVQFQEHRGYNPEVVLAAERAEGASAIQRLYEAGRLRPDVSFIHMNVIHADEVTLLAETGTGVIWCPFAQMRAMGAGPAEPRMIELARAGVSVGLATDIPRTVNFDALGSLAMANAAVCGTPAQAREIFRMRTVGAAETIGAAHEVGSLEVGKRADIVVRVPAASEALGTDPMWEAAVVGITQPPRLTVINGAVVFRDGQPLRIEAEGAAWAARRSVHRLIEKVGITGHNIGGETHHATTGISHL